MVRARGLEPPILSEPDPKSGASAIPPRAHNCSLREPKLKPNIPKLQKAPDAQKPFALQTDVTTGVNLSGGPPAVLTASRTSPLHSLALRVMNTSIKILLLEPINP